MPTKSWQRSAVVYQIYPSSFADSNADGIGDLVGITSKLDHIRDLGANVVWLSPIYPSPRADMGYDISDYRNIDPQYGTLEDWDRLVEGVHQRGMKLIMDLVVNHTSDEHAWFTESRSSKTNPKRDWYIWRPAKYDANGNRQPPNNWRSSFQGSAWEWDEVTQEYYLHIFLSKQPDLNWENAEVRVAVFEMMRFWLDRGCDGFRMDVINIISKTDGLPDAPVTQPEDEYQYAGSRFANGPRVHEYLQEMKEKVLSKYDILTVGETPYTDDAYELAKYVTPPAKELDHIFMFEHVGIDTGEPDAPMPRKWALSELKGIFNKWQTLLRPEGFWNSLYLCNHDQPRPVSRFGNDSDKWRVSSAKLLATLETCLSGTLYVYQGEDIGMRNFPRSWGIEEYKDCASINFYNKIYQRRKEKAENEEVDMSDILDGLQRKARDHARTPMQWDASPHGGFTTGTPWMRTNDDYPEWNVSKQVDDPGSVLNYWKGAIRLRKEHDVLVYGDFYLLSPEDERVFAFTRTDSTDNTAIILLNFNTEETQFSTNEVQDLQGKATLRLSNYEVEDKTLPETVTLRGWEARIYIFSKE